MTENNFSRGMLLGVVTLLHVLVLVAVVSLAMEHVEPATAPPMVLTMLLPTDTPQPPQVKPQPPKPREIPPEPVVEHVEPLPEPAPVREPAPEPVVPPPPPIVPPVAAPAITAPPPPPVPPAPVVVPPEPIVEPNYKAAYLNNPAPVYPVLAKRKREQGTTLLRVYVSAEGKPLDVVLYKSSGSPTLDKAAIAAVRQWTFVPAKRGKEALAAWARVPIDFEL